MEIQQFIRARLEEGGQPRWMTQLDLRVLKAHTDPFGPPCRTVMEMAARWADHPSFQEVADVHSNSDCPVRLPGEPDSGGRRDEGDR